MLVSGLDALGWVLAAVVVVGAVAFAGLALPALRWARRFMAAQAAMRADAEARHAAAVESIRRGARRAKGRFRL